MFLGTGGWIGEQESNQTPHLSNPHSHQGLIPGLYRYLVKSLKAPAQHQFVLLPSLLFPRSRHEHNIPTNQNGRTEMFWVKVAQKRKLKIKKEHLKLKYLIKYLRVSTESKQK
jgi:hypothetical protein